MEKNVIRLLKADEIECRVSVTNEKGLSLLLYKDARVDQRILDETFGAFGWKRSHQCIDGNLYCTVEVFDKETMQWIAKQDVGTMGYTEKEKSQASDSFKRACFNWGIGRELYSAPFIWIPAGKASIQMKEGSNKEKRYYCNDRFSVISIAYNNDREISALVINNDKGQTVYELKAKADTGSRKQEDQLRGKKEGIQQKSEPKKEGISKEQMDLLQEELKRTGVAMEAVQERYKITAPESMNEKTYKRVSPCKDKSSIGEEDKIMRLEEFAKEVLKGVEEKAGGSLKVRIVPGAKNNGITLTGITAFKHEGKGGVCIYLDNYYGGYCDGRITLGWIAEDVYGKLMEHCNDLDGVDMGVLWNWEAAKGRIRAKLVNREMNRELLKKVPYREFLDLAVIYYVTLDGLSESGTAAFTVSDQNMEVWRKDENALYQMAVSNMRLDGEPVFEDMEEIIRSMIPDAMPDLAVGMPKIRSYVLTNPKKVFGAVELLDGNTLTEIGDKLGSDYMVLPSSLHESIILPVDGRISYQELADIVTDINRNVVSIVERLSDHVYLYERKEGALRIAA